MMRTTLTRLFLEFIRNERTGGLILVGAAVLSMLISNTSWNIPYLNMWQYEVGFTMFGVIFRHTIAEWINEGLMTLFFLLVGLEIEREIHQGELSELKNALLPIAAATGGMIIPALIHFAFNKGTITQSGFGIPMATDIAFSLGVLSLFGKKIPGSLKIFLTALAIIDDLGAVIVIAFFYVQDLSFIFLGCSLGVLAILVVMNNLKINNIPIYILGGVLMWLLMLKSGVHATITGVLLAFAIPFRSGGVSSPSYKTWLLLEKAVPLLIVPIFVLANTAIVFSSGWYESLIDRNTLGIFIGLLLGKPLGITLFSFLAIRAGLCSLPDDMNYRFLAGVGILGGIGFTMSIFISDLAFTDAALIQNSKMAILSGSIAASVIGVFVLSRVAARSQNR